jgi:solute carrier family 25 2-oxodicarboxylate transporter 21
MNEHKEPNKKPTVVPFSHRLLAGGIAGVCEILVMYPTDVVKTRAQLEIGKQQIGFIKAFFNLIKNEKLGLYRGILPPILVEAPKRAVKFAANESYKPLFAGKNGEISKSGAVGAGVAAGITEAFIVVPFELVKIRLQDKSNVGKYLSTWDAVTKIAKMEGLSAFYKGLESTLWRHALWNGGYFGVIPIVQNIFPSTKNEKEKMFYNFIAGALAGTVGTILNTPSDVVKSRIQNQPSISGQVQKYNWALPAMKQIAQEEGFSALYKGFVPKVVRLGPGGGILLVVFDFVMKLLKDMPEKKSV